MTAPAKPPQPDLEFASVGGCVLHRQDCIPRQGIGMRLRINVQGDEARRVSHGADQASVGGALDAEARQRPELADPMIEDPGRSHQAQQRR
jgi:hypothetical protein